MGSIGTGRFKDYQTEAEGQKNGRSGEDDQCGKEFSVYLEDVERSEFYTTHESLPDVGAQLIISVDRRVTAIAESGEVVGNLPTQFNYLKFCIDEGYKYSSIVTQSLTTPMPRVEITVSPLNSE